MSGSSLMSTVLVHLCVGLTLVSHCDEEEDGFAQPGALVYDQTVAAGGLKVWEANGKSPFL